MQSFLSNTVVYHKQFGKGIVTYCHEGTAREVQFKEPGSRLVHTKDISTTPWPVSAFKKDQFVVHETYGIGNVLNLAQARTYTVKFQEGIFEVDMSQLKPYKVEEPEPTGWPVGMCQDDCKALSQWLSNRIDSLKNARDAVDKIIELSKD